MLHALQVFPAGGKNCGLLRPITLVRKEMLMAKGTVSGVALNVMHIVVVASLLYFFKRISDNPAIALR
jgi:hypothetical protein